VADDEDNVIHPVFSILPVATDRLKDGHCRHRHSTVHPNKRIVVCSACGAQLDPIAELVRLANIADRFKWIASEKEKIEKEIERLKRERRNLRAQVQRLRKKVGT
jgi:cell division protein FtsB